MLGGKGVQLFTPFRFYDRRPGMSAGRWKAQTVANTGSSIRAGCANELSYRGGKTVRRRCVGFFTSGVRPFLNVL